eukprot:2109923-Pyramimonas_sp.AAC.1
MLLDQRLRDVLPVPGHLILTLHLQAPGIPRHSYERVVDLLVVLVLRGPELHRPGVLDPSRRTYDDFVALVAPAQEDTFAPPRFHLGVVLSLYIVVDRLSDLPGLRLELRTSQSFAS